MPRISVILPVYNAQQYLAAALDSVLGQTCTDFECICIDDGSTDQSGKILDDYCARDARFRLIRRPNTGIVGALNDGLAVATGDLIARMDADDISLPDRLGLQVQFLDQHPDIDAVGSRVIVIDPCGLELFTSEHKLTHAEIDAALLAGNGWAIVHPAVMIRRSTLQKLGGYRQEFNFLEDVDLFLRLGEVGHMANLPQALLKYRQHPQSVTKTKVELQTLLWEQALRQAHQRRGIVLPEGWHHSPKPTPPPEQQLRQWAWKALEAGRKDVARVHARRALWLEPMNKESWRVLFCAIRGH